MYNSFFKLYYIVLISFFFFIILFNCTNSVSTTSTTEDLEIHKESQNTKGLFWPIPGNHNYTSYFGKRRSPTTGASTYHSGVDVGATSGTKLYSCIDGKVTFLAFKGAGGYTLTVTNGNLSVSFCHISPKFLVTVGQTVKKGELIARVGPKNVYGVKNNPYRDRNGNPTNGATTGSHLHLTIRKRRHSRQSFIFILIFFRFIIRPIYFD